MLREIVATDIFRFLLVFLRLGAAMMLMPALGGVLVSPRTRLMLALAVAFVALPPLLHALPVLPKNPYALASLAIGEIIVGLFFGTMMQLLLAALDLAGNYIGYSIGLTNALISDPVTEQQSQLISGFLNLAAVTAMMLSDTHHVMLRAVIDSYSLFPPGASLMMGDFANHLVSTMGASFLIGLKLAAPMLVFSLIFNAGLGLLNRLVPQMQVFFVGMPVQILGGLSVLMLVTAVMLLWFLRYYNDQVGAFLAPG